LSIDHHAEVPNGERRFVTPHVTSRARCGSHWGEVCVMTVTGVDPRTTRVARRLRGASVLLAAAIAVSLAVAMRTSARDRGEGERLVAALGLSPGMTVADVGAGSGEFTVLLGEAVGASGRVFSTEISSSRLDEIRRAAARAGLDNVTVIEADERHSHLPEDCCDAILLRRVYHHFTHPESTNATLVRALRPGGILAVIDFEPGASGASPPGVPESRGGHGVPRALLVEELSAAGLHAERTKEQWSGRDYLVLFRKPA
jgi:predicted methyltransferase